MTKQIHSLIILLFNNMDVGKNPPEVAKLVKKAILANIATLPTESLI